MKRNQNGFSAVEGLLILIIIGIVGFVGWYVYHSKNSINKTLNNAANTSIALGSKKKSATSKSSSSANPYVGWKTYNATDGTSFKYPANWTLANISQTSYISLNSPLDSSTGLEYQLVYGPSENRSQVLKDTTAANIPLNTTLTKPLFMLTMDYNNADGKDIDGLFVSDTNSAKGSSLNPTFIGFTPKNGSIAEAFEAVLQPPHYQQNSGETVATYQRNQYYQNVIKIFESLK